MKNLLLIAVISLSAFSCELLDAVKSVNKMPDQMNGMNDNMTDMKDKIGELEMSRDLDNVENYVVISPVPYKLLAPATKFGEFGPAMDIIKWFYTRRQTVEGSSFRDNVPFGGAFENGDLSPEAYEYERMKIRYANALAAVAGLLPQNKTEQLVAVLENGNEYSGSVVELLTMRYYFITNVLLENKYKDTVLKDIGELEQAVVYLKNAEYIARLPYVNALTVTTTSFEAYPEYNEALSYGVDTVLINKYWNKLNKAFEKNLKIGSYAANEDQKAAQRQRMLAVKAEIDQGLARSQQYLNNIAP
ncbi:MAG: hypothetical protein ACK4VO_06315 [Pseudobdellovibrio sp.]